MPDDILTDVEAATREDELRAALVRALRDLARARAKTEDLVEAVQRAAHDGLDVQFARSPVKTPPRDRRAKTGETALWHLTDWQGAKRTTSYNSEVMRTRVHQFVDKATAITEIQRSNHPVRSCAILLGGDMVEGLFNFPTQVFEVDATIFDQWTSVSQLLIEVVEQALATNYDVTVYAE